ncbi:MAG: acyltransferase, partial [Pedobacter sp.]
MVKLNTANTHLVQADYIRAFASLMVAVYHLGGKVLPVLNYGWLGVEMFFFLSGFIICWALPLDYSIKKHGYTFIKKRLIRIEPPYIISIVILILLTSVFEKGVSIDYKNVFLHIGYLNSFF